MTGTIRRTQERDESNNEMKEHEEEQHKESREA